jgi:hypothetical protein
MSEKTRLVTPLGPAAISIHDNGHMTRNSCRINNRMLRHKNQQTLKNKDGSKKDFITSTIEYASEYTR